MSRAKHQLTNIRVNQRPRLADCAICGPDMGVQNSGNGDKPRYYCAGKRPKQHGNGRQGITNPRTGKYSNVPAIHYQRARNYNHHYGIAWDVVEALFVKQGSVCAICKGTLAITDRYWVLDHCHTTGEVRGVLCTGCNTAIGKLGDNPNIILNAYYYVKC